MKFLEQTSKHEGGQRSCEGASWGRTKSWCEECLSGDYLKRLWSPNVIFRTYKLNLPRQTHIQVCHATCGGRGGTKDTKVSPFLPQECNSRILILYQKTLLNDKDITWETSYSNPLLLLKVDPDKKFTVGKLQILDYKYHSVTLISQLLWLNKEEHTIYKCVTSLWPAQLGWTKEYDTKRRRWLLLSFTDQSRWVIHSMINSQLEACEKQTVLGSIF